MRVALGYVSVDKNYTWNVVGPQCGALVMAHELGHNMGLTHSRRQGDTGGTRYGYALGYGVDNVFATIMAYPQSFNTTWVGNFSNPTLVCRGVTCGVSIGQANEAYAAQAIHNVRDEIAAFRPIAGGSSSSGGSSSGGSSSGGTSSGGSSSGGSSSGGGSCSGIPQYSESNSYNTGDVVQNVGNKYTCTVGGWCTVGGPYAPSTGWAWPHAWNQTGSCQ